MASPMADPPDAWKPALDEVRNWIASDNESRIAHIQGPRASGKTSHVPLALSHGRKVIYMTNFDDSERLYKAWGHTGGTRHSASDNKSGTNTAKAEGTLPPQNGQGVEGIKLGVLPGVCSYIWAHSRVGPKSRYLLEDVTVIIQVDPSVTADFAMAMAVCFDWICRTPGGRMLTLSSGPPIPQILSLYRRTSVPIFVLPEYRPRPTYISVPDDRVSMEIFREIRKPLSGSHAVVCFYPAASVENLRKAGITQLRLVDGDGSQGRTHLHVVDITQRRQSNRVTLIQLPQGNMPCARIGGFDSVHVVPSKYRRAVLFDKSSGVFASFLVRLTQDEFAEQLAWAHRSDAATVAVYHRTETEHDHAAPFSPRRRTEVENRQVAGFIWQIIALRAMYPSMDVSAAIGAFVPNESLVKETVRRLGQQGLLKGDGIGGVASGFPTYQPSATNIRQKALMNLLPFLNYDPALAYLVSRPSVCPFESRVKINLAALLATGIENVFLALPQDPQTRTRLLGGCRGCTRAFADKGSWWLLLGVLNAIEHSETQSGTRSTAIPPVAAPTPADAAVPKENIRISAKGWERMMSLRSHLLSVLKRSHVQIHEVTGEEPSRLSVAAERNLMTDVFDCFMHSCVLVENINGEETFRTAAGSVAMAPNSRFASAFDIEDIRRVDPRSLLTGVSHAYERNSGAVSFLDWTWIPDPAIGNRVLLAEDGNLANVEEVLASPYEFTPNTDTS